LVDSGSNPISRFKQLGVGLGNRAEPYLEQPLDLSTVRNHGRSTEFVLRPLLPDASENARYANPFGYSRTFRDPSSSICTTYVGEQKFGGWPGDEREETKFSATVSGQLKPWYRILGIFIGRKVGRPTILAYNTVGRVIDHE